mmetsp:Transcript_59295/g.158743  ORF Transcript_59295/g.158743 Transcript_59295/m.158743 type:complete len:202 (+) Transcript_59295:1702-2307(+)
MTFLQLFEDIGDVPHAPLRNLHVILLREALEQHPWRIVEEGVEREHLCHPGLGDGVPLRGGLCFLGLLQLLEVLVPTRLDVYEEEMLGGFTSVGHTLVFVQGSGETLHLCQQLQAPLQHEIHPTPPGIIGVVLQLLDALSQSDQIPLGDIQRHDLVKQVVERLVTVGYQQNLLVRKIVVQQVYDLHCGVRFSCARRPDNHC